MGFFAWLNEKLILNKISKRTCESESERMQRVFYEDYKMPCCGNECFIEVSKVGAMQTIVCARCYTKFNIITFGQRIERIR